MRSDLLGTLLLVVGLACVVAALCQLVGWMTLGVSPALQLIIGTIILVLRAQRARHQARV